MWEFLKRIFIEKKEGVTLVLIDENEPDLASAFKLRARDMILPVLVVACFSFVLSGLIFLFTPLNSFYQQRLDDQFRDEVIAISERVGALQDSLFAREIQLNDIKAFVRDVPDTLFEVQANVMQQANRFYNPTMTVFSYDMLTHDALMNQLSDRRGWQFPGIFPVEGALTQRFSRETGHLGIDLAVPSGQEFRAVAGGVVVNTAWAINYGYVIYIQHDDGVVTIYKHAKILYKTKGDIVLRGERLGRAGDIGVLSSGSHLHFELWKNGIAQDPLHYLI